MSTVAVHSGAVTQQYDALVSRLKRMRREGRAPALAIVSSSSGAGVSSVAKALTDRMNAGAKARRAEDVTISISAEAFIHPPASVGEFMSRVFEEHEDAFEFVFDRAIEAPSPPTQTYHHAVSFEDCLLAARSMFRLVLVECRPLRKGADIATVALLVDAILIVLEANKTTRSQTERLVNTIQIAGGTVLGYVLNKRNFPIPSSVYQLFEKAGLI